MYELDAPCNSKNSITKSAISLGTSGKLQDGFKFIALNTRKKCFRRSWGVIPLPDTVITRVNALGSDQPEKLIFTDRHGSPIGDAKLQGVDPSDVDYIDIPGVDSSDVDNIEIPGVDVDIQEPQVIDIVIPDIPPTDKSSI